MPDTTCPRCGKKTTIEVIDVLPGSGYEMVCKICGTRFVVDAERQPSSTPLPAGKVRQNPLNDLPRRAHSKGDEDEETAGSNGPAQKG